MRIDGERLAYLRGQVVAHGTFAIRTAVEALRGETAKLRGANRASISAGPGADEDDAAHQCLPGHARGKARQHAGLARHARGRLVVPHEDGVRLGVAPVQRAAVRRPRQAVGGVGAVQHALPAQGRGGAALGPVVFFFGCRRKGEDDLFHALPFIRWQDDCGCERTTWGAASLPFRVASPLDPDFQRPQAIILPRLDDLKRGAARGVALLAPKSLANVLRRVSPKMPPGDSGPGNRCGLCWMFSLSIPVVTICALIILMILINLLNLLFGWLPWAILALPRLCGKLLKD